LKAFFDGAVGFCLLSWCFLIPLYLALGEDMYPTFFHSYNIVIDAIFWTDILLTFRTAYIGNDGRYVTDGKEIAHKYLRFWFFFDFLAVFPFDSVIMATYRNDDNNPVTSISGIGKTARLMRITKMFRLIRYIRLLGADRNFQGKCILKCLRCLKCRENLERLAKFFFLLVMIIHLFACGWVIVHRV
jgi:hypothetical protein